MNINSLYLLRISDFVKRVFKFKEFGGHWQNR